ncbi:transglycosylase SLT domain-containing protein [Pantoea osteomyelitidis]|uniref:Transglycosylase SLT domain-containing protein n=1 Tax=Pantoea osteomyelitidis TaxID=3230026 RepID=A0ABW7PQS2_9GAMM
MVKFLLFVFSFLFSCAANATCWQLAEETFHIDGKLLMAIAQVESAMNPRAMGKNSDGSWDTGLMQINSRHLPALRKSGVNEFMLQNDPCISVLTGAAILSDMMMVYGYTWEAVGAYHAGTAKNRHQQRMNYAAKVWRYYLREKEKVVKPE